MSTLSANATFAEPISDIQREEIRRRLGDASLVLLNVLPREAFNAGRIPGSVNLPVAELPQQARTLLPNLSQEIAVYCGADT
jgi:rhodanese-related sulfurtransferase